jgi:cytochrome c oxidase cbb3-type subunit IV
MEYEVVAKFAQTWGLVYFALLFALVLLYALWPSNQKSFDEAANIPLNDGPLENEEDQ